MFRDGKDISCIGIYRLSDMSILYLYILSQKQFDELLFRCCEICYYSWKYLIICSSNTLCRIYIRHFVDMVKYTIIFNMLYNVTYNTNIIQQWYNLLYLYNDLVIK